MRLLRTSWALVAISCVSGCLDLHLDGKRFRCAPADTNCNANLSSDTEGRGGNDGSGGNDSSGGGSGVDACLGVVCTPPVPAVCLSAATRRTYVAPGTCNQGTCSYASVDSSCASAEICQTGACQWNEPALASLTVSPGGLAFAPEKTAYAVAVVSGTPAVSVTASVAQPTRVVMRINGTVVASGGKVTLPLSMATTLVRVAVQAESGAKREYLVTVTRPGLVPAQQAYLKASNPGADDALGTAIALSADGTTLAVGAFLEDSNAVGVDGNQADESVLDSGAVYIFVRVGSGWAQQAYLKASNTGTSGDEFGAALALSADGNTLAVGAHNEDSNGVGVNGEQGNDVAEDSGAVYVFTRAGSTWTQQAYVKASNTSPSSDFGGAVALSGDGNTLVVGARDEDGAATGINGNQADRSATSSGAAYSFARSGGVWTQTAYLKASNTNASDAFGRALALSADGSTLAVGASSEDSAATGINGDQTDNSISNSGAVYVFSRSGGGQWAQQAYVKASNPGASDGFGNSVALSSNGSTLAVGADFEDSKAAGINGDQADNSISNSGAVYVFARTGGAWAQQVYLKASNPGAADHFGDGVSLTANGNVLAVGGSTEDSSAVGIDGDQTNNSALASGAVYLFARAGNAWTQQSYVKASNTDSGDAFGTTPCLTADGAFFAAGASGESSSALGVNGNQADNSLSSSGAAYVFTVAH